MKRIRRSGVLTSFFPAVTAAAILSVAGAAASADTIAMPPNANSGTQFYGALAGTDFNTNQTISITQLGVFDNLGDGILNTISPTQPVVVQLWNRNTGIALATLNFGGGSSIGTDTATGSGDVFYKSLSAPLTLAPGNYYISADYDGSEGFIDANAGTWTTTPNTGGGAVSYVAGGRYSAGHGQMYGGAAPFTTNGGVQGPSGHSGPEYSLANFQFNLSTGPVATPITGLTGWNQAVVLAPGSPSLGGGFDGQSHGLIVNGFAGATVGLPASGAVTLTASGDQFQFQPYTGNDSAQWTGGTPALGVSNHSVTLSLTTPGSYSSLAFLGSSGNGGNGSYTGDVTLTFVGGATAFFSAQLNEPDWTSGINSAPLANMNFDSNGGAAGGYNIGLDETILNLTPAEQQLQIQSITFSGGTLDGNGQGAIDNIVAVSGVAVPEPASLALLGLSAVTLIRRRRRD